MSKSTISSYELNRRFPTPDAARQYMELKRWKGQPTCPSCGAVEPIYKRPVAGYYRCPGCKLDFTVRTGTIMERSHIPLDKWLLTMYLLTTARKGISSLQLAKEIGITQKSAWFLLHRIREACAKKKDDDDQNGFLCGIVEADEAYFGGKEANKHEHKKLKAGRGAVGKIAVLGIRERGGRVQGKVLLNTGISEVQGEITASVGPRSVLFTDEHPSYRGMAQFYHAVVNHSAKEFVNGMAHTNGIESVWAVLKRGFYGTYHSFSGKHLQRYVDEFTFRLNEGNVKHHTMTRIDSLLARTVGTRITYKELIAM
jgi:transposase-like protein